MNWLQRLFHRHSADRFIGFKSELDTGRNLYSRPDPPGRIGRSDWAVYECRCGEVVYQRTRVVVG